MKQRAIWLGLAAAVLAGFFSAADKAAGSGKRPAAAADRETVDMFAAMAEGKIDVRFIPRSSRSATVLVENKTERPLAIKLPEAFAGVPVLAQIGGFGGGVGGGIGGGAGGFGLGGGTSQGVGGGFGEGGGEVGGGDFGGFFNVAPEQTRKLVAPTVCLEYGKREPTPRMKYKIVPLSSFTDKPEVLELCRMLGRGQISQRVAQAAAWRLANGLSWRQLASLDRVRLRNGYREKYFTPQDIAVAMRVAEAAVRRAQLRAQDSLSNRDSLSVR